VRLVMVFTPVSTFPNRKVKSGVRKIAEEELGRAVGEVLEYLYGSGRLDSIPVVLQKVRHFYL